MGRYTLHHASGEEVDMIFAYDPARYERDLKRDAEICRQRQAAREKEWADGAPAREEAERQRLAKAAELRTRQEAYRKERKALFTNCSICHIRVLRTQAWKFRARTYCPTCRSHRNTLADMAPSSSGSGKRVVRSTRGL